MATVRGTSRNPAAPTPSRTVSPSAAAYGVSATYSLSSPGLLSAQYETVGGSGTGTFTQSGGTNAISSFLSFGVEPGSSGTYNLNGGTLILSGLNGTQVTAAFNFGGGTLQANGTIFNTLPMTLTGSGGNATVDTAGYTVNLAGSLSGPGGLTKTDSGTLVLAASNTYSGGTTVAGGILQFNGTNAVPGSGSITINSGAAVALASFGPYGTVAGWLNSGKITSASAGALALIAASDTETINMSGYPNLSLGASGNVTFSGTLTPSGTTYNLGGGSGTLTFTPAITGAASLNVSGRGTVVLTGSNKYTGGTTVSGGTLDFAGPAASPTAGILSVNSGGYVVLGALVGSSASATAESNSDQAPIDTSSSAAPVAPGMFSGTSGSPGGATWLDSVESMANRDAAVPEPGTIALLAVGMLGLAPWLRRWKTVG